MIIIASSGMATGGRVLHHLKQRLPSAQTTVLLSGYQALGTRGRSLQDGAKTMRIYGEDVSVNAKVETLEGLSAHADQSEILKWLAGFKKPPKVTYIVHGEPEAAQVLRDVIKDKLGWNVKIAHDKEVVSLSSL